MAEVLLRRRLEECAVAGRVGSAGFLESGYPATVHAVATMAAVGLDLSGHRSRTVTPELLDGADLVVAMTRQHAVELAVMAPRTWPRVFQVRDLVRRAELTRARRPEEPMAAWLSSVGAGRRRSTLLDGSMADDIPDPVGGPKAGYDDTRSVLDDLMTRLARLVG
jgi:protein-tyrosine phosphatase